MNFRVVNFGESFARSLKSLEKGYVGKIGEQITRTVAHTVQEGYEHTYYKYAENSEKSGKRQSQAVKYNFDKNKLTGTIRSESESAYWQEMETSPHTIRPTHGRFLKWESKDHTTARIFAHLAGGDLSKTAVFYHSKKHRGKLGGIVREGAVYYNLAEEVFHPGTKNKKIFENGVIAGLNAISERTGFTFAVED